MRVNSANPVMDVKEKKVVKRYFNPAWESTGSHM